MRDYIKLIVAIIARVDCLAIYLKKHRLVTGDLETFDKGMRDIFIDLAEILFREKQAVGVAKVVGNGISFKNIKLHIAAIHTEAKDVESGVAAQIAQDQAVAFVSFA